MRVLSEVTYLYIKVEILPSKNPIPPDTFAQYVCVRFKIVRFLTCVRKNLRSKIVWPLAPIVPFQDRAVGNVHMLILS
jgi:hypothetical protein